MTASAAQSSRPTRVAALLCALALVVLAPGVRAGEPPGVEWSTLDAQQQQLLKKFEGQWSQLPPERQAALAKGSSRWLTMTPFGRPVEPEE